MSSEPVQKMSDVSLFQDVYRKNLEEFEVMFLDIYELKSWCHLISFADSWIIDEYLSIVT